MKASLRHRCQGAKVLVLLAGVFVAMWLVPPRAFAALGGNVASVQADQAQMKAKRTVQSTTNYTVHEITTPYGSVVREYVAPNGTVFGVAWRGAFQPNLQQLLGSYYGKFAQAVQNAKEAQPKSLRTPLFTVDQPDFVMHSMSHTHAYSGQAYIPGMIPSGVEAKEIR